jgi:hypothetical protein
VPPPNENGDGAAAVGAPNKLLAGAAEPNERALGAAACGAGEPKKPPPGGAVPPKSPPLEAVGAGCPKRPPPLGVGGAPNADGAADGAPNENDVTGAGAGVLPNAPGAGVEPKAPAAGAAPKEKDMNRKVDGCNVAVYLLVADMTLVVTTRNYGTVG